MSDVLKGDVLYKPQSADLSVVYAVYMYMSCHDYSQWWLARSDYTAGDSLRVD